jgi:purine-nucleoside phosphorylase
VLGSGLGDFADGLWDKVVFDTGAIPRYPRSSVAGHKGRIVFGRTGRRDVLVFQGRLHFYECGDLSIVLHPVHVAAALGVKTLIVTNAAGGVNRSFRPGDLMLIEDQINMTFEHLPGAAAGEQTVDLFSPRLRRIAMEAAGRRGISLRTGVYAGVKGPSYETAAEVEFLRRVGADAVGMSTVFETRRAVRLGMEVLGLTCITNLATGIGAERLSHAEVTEVGLKVRKVFGGLLEDVIEQI